ncbi:hypothetical protein BCR44DRAFT_1426621 [Catenaria anguillulae PL171]|uniref:Peripheral subunit-binding (PSBD) domain-containing protein n=1 Tax=Catenaria anguillulae PL171 TaxID=765915 RepID=A0A1Y2HZS2_9FUNG|nr:hypothetical protein BCR44DRAFT_1426621 [Catenaria anguillulae PL171]
MSALARRAILLAARPSARRHLHASVVAAAQTLLMPALSPTMTEGSLINAGDVLFEDGILAKVMIEAGTKGVKVNSVIAVVAEEGEDVSSLDLSAMAAPGPPASEPVAAAATAPPMPAPAAPVSALTSTAAAAAAASAAKPATSTKRHAHIAPAVSHLIHLYDLSSATVASIPVTGPQGRLLKGDVLAYVQAHKLQPRTVTHPPPRAAVPLFKPVAFEVPATSKSPVRSASSVLAHVKVPGGASVVVNGAPVGKPAAASSKAQVHVKVDTSVRRVLKPEPQFALKTKAQELQFYEFLGGARKPLQVAASSSVTAPSASKAKQDLFDYLGAVPRADDARYHDVVRVEVAKAAGFASPKESAAAVELVRKALVQASL